MSYYTVLETMRVRLWKWSEKKCHWCGKPTQLRKINTTDTATIDHVIPRYRGGTNDPDNLVSACSRCNSRRNYEDHLGLPEGSMLGIYKVIPTWRAEGKRLAMVYLSGDEKKALFQPKEPMTTGAELVKAVEEAERLKHENRELRCDRDRMVTSLSDLRNEKRLLEAEIARLVQCDDDRVAEINRLNNELGNITIRRLVSRRLIAFLQKF